MNEIRVIAPSDSWKTDKQDSYKRAQTRLESEGYSLVFAKHVKEVAYLGTARAIDRARDFNEAFKDNNVKAIISLHGGFSSNEILPYINWSIVKNNPKPLIGYSDITVLCNAIYAKTGLPAYLGPNLGTIGYKELWEYTLDSLVKTLEGNRPYALIPSPSYIDDEVVKPAEKWVSLQEGKSEGVLVGGNIQSFFLLQGTDYQPSLDYDFILAIEDDALSKEFTLHGLSRNLESLLQLPNARKNIKGLLIGRFEEESKVSQSDLATVIKAKGLESIPVIANMDFGHTTPMITLPIGGKLIVEAKADYQKIIVS